MILTEKQIEMYKHCMFLIEAQSIKHRYRGVNLECDMNIETYNKYKSRFNEAFRGIDAKYDEVLEQCYTEHFKIIPEVDENIKDFNDFKKKFKLENYGQIYVNENSGHEHLRPWIEVELHYICHTYRQIPMAIRFYYSFKQKKFMHPEFDGSD